MTSEETIKNQAEEIATLKASVELLKETMAHSLACMKTAREVHKADVAVIKASHKVEVDKLKNDCHKYCQPNGNRPRVETFSAGGGPLIFTL